MFCNVKLMTGKPLSKLARTVRSENIKGLCKFTKTIAAIFFPLFFWAIQIIAMLSAVEVQLTHMVSPGSMHLI